MRARNRADLRPTLAIGEPAAPREPRTIIVGIPETAWDALPDNGTFTFDLRSAGIFLQLVVFRAADGAAVAQVLQSAESLLNAAPDVGIPEPTRQ